MQNYFRTRISKRRRPLGKCVLIREDIIKMDLREQVLELETMHFCVYTFTAAGNVHE
jgi:hypothetical protein